MKNSVTTNDFHGIRLGERKVNTYCDSGVPCAQVGDAPPQIFVINGGQGFMRRITPRRMKRDLRRIEKILPPGAPFVLLGYPLPDANWTMDALADRMQCVIQRHHAHVTLVGISFGGIVAARIAARCPSTIDRLILISSAHRLSRSGTQSVQQQLSGVLSGDDKALTRSFTSIFRARWRNWLLRLGLWLGRRRFAQSMNPASTVVPYLQALLADTCAESHWPATIGCDCLIIGGRNDQFFGDGMMEEAASLIERATLHLADGEAHMMMIERASAVAHAIGEWLGNTSHAEQRQ